MGVNRKLLAVFGAYCSLAPCLQLWNLTVIGVNRKHLTVIGVYFIEKVNVLQHEFKRAPGSASLLPNIFDIFSDARRDKKVDCKTTLSNRQRAVKMTLLTGSAVWRRSLRLTASRTVPVGVKATYWKAYCATIVRTSATTCCCHEPCEESPRVRHHEGWPRPFDLNFFWEVVTTFW